MEGQQVNHLVISCSHPHSDHNGGILALMKKPEAFFQDKAMTQPRFAQITFIDDAVPTSLYASLRTNLVNNPALMVKHINATGINAYRDISKPGDAVFIENIPYTSTTQAGVHGRSLVTRIVLSDGHTNIDFDDADSAVIGKTVGQLKMRGDVRVDSFVVPHHGSAFHDIEPILALSPRQAIITVNPENPYGHPAPKILLSLMDKLGPENVLFTGSKDYIEMSPKGLGHANFTAADSESYLLFVRPNLKRAIEKKTLTPDLAKTYKEIYDRMYSQPRTELSTAVRNPVPSSPSKDPSVAILTDRVEATGSLLTPEFEIATIGPGGKDFAAVRQQKVFPATTSRTGRRPFVEVRDLKSSRAAIEKLALTSYTEGANTEVELRVESAPGLEDGVAAPDLVPISKLRGEPAGISSPVSGRVRDGGMVNLTGDKVFTADSANTLVGGTLDTCQQRLCVTTAGPAASSYTLPFEPNALFWEVWNRVNNRQIDTFYLSINPTRKYLAKSDDFNVPFDHLRYGSGAAAPDLMANKVVTEGDIGHSEIGRILWLADIEFKSESLGLDVITGAKRTVVPDSILNKAEANRFASLVDPSERWCRLYWASGAQTVQVDAVTHKVSLAGGAVVARAEGMRLLDGSLTDTPGAGWCADAKRVAARLEAEALSATARPVLSQLRKVAEIQNFSHWARDHRISMSEKLTQKLSGLKPTDYDVPQWTSGIKSAPEVVFQRERHMGLLDTSLLIHYTGAGYQTVDQCVVKSWPTRSALESSGCKFDEDKKEWKDCDDKFESVWANLPIEAAACVQKDIRLAGHVKVEGNATRPAAADDSLGLFATARKDKVLKVIRHFSDIEVHGGVALDTHRAFLESAWRTDGTLTAPDGSPLFRQLGGDVHFWNFNEALSEHVVIEGGKVVGAHAEDGKLRFVVKSVPSGTVRHELRAKRAPGFTEGVEWAEMREASDGSLLMEKAAWPCGRDCTRVADASLTELGAYMDLNENEQPLILVENKPENTWIVELDVERLGNDFDKLRKNIDCSVIDRCLALARDYSQWGFAGEALAMYADVLLRADPDAEDTILASILRRGLGVDPFEEEAITEAALQQKRVKERVDNGTLTVTVALSELHRIESAIESLSPESRAGLWLSQSKVCQELVKKAVPETQRQVRQAAERYSSMAKEVSYLTVELDNPWER
jgi:hypothetical protein